MTESKITRTIEEVTGYYADDGTFFRDKAECEKYEQTAKMVIFKEFKALMIGEPFPECSIWERFGYGGEEFMLAVIEIKNEADVHTANMYAESTHNKTVFTSDMIGKRYLVNLGYGCDGDCAMLPRTEDELIDMFKKDINKFFVKESGKDDNT